MHLTDGDRMDSNYTFDHFACDLCSLMLSCSLTVAPELVLRKVINFSDCTVCLDKRNASGKIEFYQDPLLYKCSFRTRLHFTYDNINAKIPAVIKVSKRERERETLH